ncbi:SH3 domain-containing protein [Solidesulfovibrio alcoholivorans]|uniref:SH3 domain-containing protein n=1 Tax=Solidesulfovibrio alcoholivorans TaxID=81406 RepID=UPI00049511AD|nr:SH3 domain-containing protein [Solidesulfovibrio alcoholivorans]
MNRLLRFCRPLVLVLFVLAVFGCAKPTPPTAPLAPPTKAVGKGEVEDLRVLPQDLNAYLRPDTADKALYPQEQIGLRMENFVQEWTAPWRMSKPGYARKAVEEIFRRFEKSPGFAAPGQRNSPEFAASLHAAAGLGSYPNVVRKAVTVKNTNLRGMPTASPRFADPSLPGEGYPFDYLQHTALPPGTPLLVTHASRDGAWLLAESALTFGWLPATDVAYVDDAAVAAFSTTKLAAVVRDQTALPEVGLTVDVGAIFPLAGPPDRSGLAVLVPVRAASGAAELRQVRLPAGAAASMPMPMTPRNVAAVGNQFMGKVYGWGGIDGKRDCSALTHDLFVPFGIYLPRNSASQAAYGGSVPLGDLPGDQKESTILSQGVPFATLVWMQGHILVYVGQYKGRPVVYHDMWGFHTFNEGGRDGRLVIGRAVVTTLRAGEEVPAVGPTHILLNRVRSMSILARPY